MAPTPESNSDTIDQGWLSFARKVPSPNFNQRPNSDDIALLVIHNISLPPAQFGGNQVERFFCNVLDWSEHPYFETIRDMQVSAHLLIRRCGEVVQFVAFHERAWHAGRSQFAGRENCNDFAIGIELEGTDEIPYTDAQYRELARVTRLLQRRYPQLDQQHICGHNDIAPDRKTDPGPAFDWQRFRASLSCSSDT